MMLMLEEVGLVGESGSFDGRPSLERRGAEVGGSSSGSSSRERDPRG